MEKKEIKPVAVIHNDYKEKFGIPRQSGRNEIISKIEFVKEYSDKNAVRGIENFSHLWLIFGFSKIIKKEFSPLVRPPRLGGNKKVGVFASRSPYRPNNLGLSSVKLERVEENGNGIALIVSGADLLDGTPIYDIKPYIPYSDCHKNATGGFAEDLKEYKLKVEFDKDLLNEIPIEKQKALISCLQDDPRPSYQEDGRIYGMAYAEFNVKFVVEADKLKVLKVEKI